MSPSDREPASEWGQRLPALMNAPRCKPGKRRNHPHSNGDAWQTPMPTTMSAAEKATLRVSRSIACHYDTMDLSNVHRNQKRMQREYLALQPRNQRLVFRKTATEKAGSPRGHFSNSARSGAPLSYFARCSDASPRYTPPEMWPTRQMGSRTYERKRKNREVYYQPAGAKTQ
jgi:hypothetical protein